MSGVYKCHACGASVVQNSDEKSTICEYCGETIVFPKAGFVQMNRANEFRAKKEFDQAIFIYENLLKAITDDPEIWWNIFLCEYGIEYVEDGNRRIPTINRMKYDSVFDNDAYKKAIAFSDEETRRIYECEAGRIEEIQKEFRKIASEEEKYDVFISYKDKEDSTGERTRDGEWAQLIYNALTDEGYNVFFSRITLRSCPGGKFEPKIFAALQSASVMIVVACSPEHVNAVWVKNEWSRFLKFRETDPNKYLIPVYADMKPEALPKQLSAYQGYEANGTGFISSLVENINKRIGKAEKQTDVQPTKIIAQVAPDTLKELKKNIELGYASVKNNKWEEADRWFENALNYNMDYAPAWWGKLVVATRDFSLYGDFRKDPEANRYFTQAMGLATEEEEKRFENDLARYDAVQKSYRCEDLFKRYSLETDEFTQYWIGDSPKDNEKNALLDKLEHKILDLAVGEREREIKETIDYYKICRKQIIELDQKFREVENENRQIAKQASKVKDALDEKKRALIQAKSFYPVFGWLWIFGLFFPPALIGAMIKTIANVRNRKKVYGGISSGQLKAEIADLQNKYIFV